MSSTKAIASIKQAGEQAAFTEEYTYYERDAIRALLDFISHTGNDDITQVYEKYFQVSY